MLDGYGDEFDVELGPLDPKDFCLELRVDVGAVGEKWIDSYQIFVCTPLGVMPHFNELTQQAAEDSNRMQSYLFGKGLLIVHEYNIDQILDAVSQNIDELKYYAFDLS